MTTEGSEQPTVLLVDDNEGMLATLKEVLELMKFRVTTAANVREALHWIDTVSFDVLLCDLHMPEASDGVAVVNAMRHTNPNAVTLVFTGDRGQEVADQILLQADEILLKPMSIATLVEVIREKLRMKGCKQVPMAKQANQIQS